MKKIIFGLSLLATAAAFAAGYTNSAGVIGYNDTPLLPGGKWHVHDADRPQPVVVAPGTASTQEKPGQPPADAIVLFDGKDTAQWVDKKGQPSAWKIENGELISTKGSDLISKPEFGDIQLHLEFCTPPPHGEAGQKRNNSGVFFMGKFELQILDCYESQTYPDGQTGAIYGQQPPLVNACRAPGQWQTYDAAFTAPRFDKAGQLTAPAYLTVFHNGVLVQNHTEILWPTMHRTLGKYTPMPPTGPLKLQDHNNPVRFRNIWVRPLKPETQN